MNKAILEGIVGTDPEMKTNAKGKASCHFRLSTREYIGKDDKGKAKYKTTWHNVVVLGSRAESAGKLIQKKSRILLEGQIDNFEIDQPGGKKFYGSRVTTFGWDFTGSPKVEDSHAPTGAGDSDAAHSDDIPV